MLRFTYFLVCYTLLINSCHGYGSPFYESGYRPGPGYGPGSGGKPKYRFDIAIASFVKEPTVGSVWFTPRGDFMYLNGSVAGLPAGKLLGVHVHQYGGLGNNCNDAGPHFNPFKQRHGGRTGYPRHAGDLGNIPVDRNGVMHFNLYVTLKGLGPFNGFIGRALVVHENTDDLGIFPDEGSRTTGNSGGRLACATIGYRAP
ncbi:unnamed protein product [Trichobilharzia szidati]|nr:unnamed protein product [Trichobilharzia szidati]